ncbi:MAG: cupin [Rhodospirillaceae bacterium]|nr:cupin [Rhodospirillaceae bacterium]
MNQQGSKNTAVATIQIDNSRVRVTEYRFSPGAETEFHVHEFDYIVIPQTDGLLLLIGPEGVETKVELTKGIAYFREAGVRHNVINGGNDELIFTEVEIK